MLDRGAADVEAGTTSFPTEFHPQPPLKWWGRWWGGQPTELGAGEGVEIRSEALAESHGLGVPLRHRRP
jgi:hypothetical protein